MTDDLATLALPMLLIVGDQDRLTPPKNSRWVQERAAAARLMIIPDAGHFAMLEKPGRVNQAIQQFTRQI